MSDPDGERVLKWFPARGFWLTTQFLEQFGINKHLFQDYKLHSPYVLSWKNNYSCELKSNCTRNHVITYTNSERQDEQAARCKEQQVMNIASMWLAAWRTTVIWFVHSASPRYRERAFTIFSPFRYIIRAKPRIILTQLTQKLELHFGFSKFRHGRLISSLNGMILKAWMRIGDWVMDNEEWGKRGMETGEWRMESGEWRVENREWGVGNGEWRTENGEWGVGNGKLRMGSGE